MGTNVVVKEVIDFRSLPPISNINYTLHRNNINITTFNPSIVPKDDLNLPKDNDDLDVGNSGLLLAAKKIICINDTEKTYT